MAQIYHLFDNEERRRFKRNPIHLRALCIVEEDVGYNCIIHDFCKGGMYLEFDQMPPASLPAPDTRVTITCTVPLPAKRVNLAMPARIVRTMEGFCGIAFIDVDAAALDILQEFARSQLPAQSGSQGPEPHEKTPPPTAIHPEPRLPLGQACCDKIGDQGMVLAKNFIDKCTRYLENRLDVEKDGALQYALFSAREALARQASTFARHFANTLRCHLNEALSEISVGEIRQADDPDPSEFSLVEDKAFHQWLTLVELSNSAETRHRQELTGLEQRLSVIFGAAVHQDNNPFRPALFSRSYLDTLGQIDMDERAHHDCHMAFKTVLADFLGPLYSELNQFLIQQNILPDLETHNRAARRTRKTEKKPSPETASPASSSSIQPQTALSPAPGTEDLQQPAFLSLASDLHALRNAIVTRNDTQTSNPDVPDEDTPCFNNDDILEALSTLQTQHHDQPAGSSHQERDYLARINEILTAGEHGKTRGIPHQKQTIIKVAGSLFASLMQDMLIALNVRAWLQRLEIPLLKLAVTDESLFHDRDHAARRVINQLSQLELYNEAGTDSAVSRKINRLLDKINDTTAPDIGVYEQIAHELSLLIKIQNDAYQANLSDLVGVCEMEQKQLLSSRNNSEEGNDWGGTVVRDNDEAGQLQQWIDKVHRLKCGDWLLFRDEQENPQRLRLAWISKNHDRYVFVNLRGLRERTLTHMEVAARLADNTAILLDNADDPALDRAQYNMLQHLHKQLLHESSHDPLTGLLNRRSFETELRDLLAGTAENHHGGNVTLCYLKIRQFDLLNSTWGYEEGDRFLIDFSTHIQSGIPGDKLAARLGGSKFGLLIKDCSLEKAHTLIQNLLTEMGSLMDDRPGAKEFMLNYSAGLVAVERHDNLTSLLQAAESCCKVAESKSGNYIHLYHEDDEEIVRQQNSFYWLERVHEALDHGNLAVRCQPIVPISAEGYGAPHHLEVLLSISDDDGNPISPEAFILAAEHHDRMPEVDKWVINHVFQWMLANHERLDQIGSFAINLSGRSLNDRDFQDFVLDICENTAVPMERICFEVTETAGIDSLSDAADFILKLKETGCSFSLDDFGSGMSSYSYLKNLPVDYLKIDGIFVKEMDKNPNDYAVVKSICEIGHFMGKKIIAEYVESEAILNELRTIGVDFAQGYTVGRPKLLQDL